MVQELARHMGSRALLAELDTRVRNLWEIRNKDRLLHEDQAVMRKQSNSFQGFWAAYALIRHLSDMLDTPSTYH